MCVAGPPPQVSGTVAVDHVDHDVPLEIDQPGRIQRRMIPGGGEERGLVDAQLMQRTDAVRIVDQRCAVLHDGVQDRPPAHPELVGELAHRAGVLTHLAARLNTRAASQHRLRVDVLGRLGPRPRRTQRVPAAPPPLHPPQPAGRPKQARSRTSTASDPAVRHVLYALGSAPTPPSTRS